MGQDSGSWPPGREDVAEEVGRSAWSRLTSAGIGDVHDVVVDGADPWHVTVTLTVPAAALIADIQQALDPLAVDVVWYVGMVARDDPGETVPADLVDPRAGVEETCGVCGVVGARWHHAVPAPTSADPIAVARHWSLCSRCHELAADGDVGGLAGRMHHEELGADCVQHIAQLLVDGGR